MRRSSEGRESGRVTATEAMAMVAVVLVSALLLWRYQPREAFFQTASPHVARQNVCLSNLSRIAHGFALYSQDWDGTFPRGIDAEDRYTPDTWREPRNDGRVFYHEVRTMPYLPDLLANYQVPRETWRCPADVGWEVQNLPDMGPSSLVNVRPSAWQKFGLSYFYLTELGLRGARPGVLAGDDAARTLVLFDGEFWHKDPDGTLRPRLCAMMADGHTQPLSSSEFQRLLREWPVRRQWNGY